MILQWALVGGVVGATTVCDLLQSHGMRRGGRLWKLPLSVVWAAIKGWIDQGLG